MNQKGSFAVGCNDEKMHAHNLEPSPEAQLTTATFED